MTDLEKALAEHRKKWALLDEQKREALAKGIEAYDEFVRNNKSQIHQEWIEIKLIQDEFRRKLFPDLEQEDALIAARDHDAYREFLKNNWSRYQERSKFFDQVEGPFMQVGDRIIRIPPEVVDSVEP
jgi:hypothetical protein